MRIYDYHGGPREFKAKTGPLIGIELELTSSRKIFLEDQISNYSDMEYWVAERDSTAHVEFVSHVLDLESLPKALEEMDKFLKSNNNIRKSLILGNSGLHINIERSRPEEDKEIKDLIYNNKRLFITLGGKHLNQMEQYSRFMDNGSKYCAVNVQDDRYEFRFFRSTIRMSDIYFSVLALLEIIKNKRLPCGDESGFPPKFKTWWTGKTTVNITGKDFSLITLDNLQKTLYYEKKAKGFFEIEIDFELAPKEYEIIFINDYITKIKIRKIEKALELIEKL